MQTKVDAAAVVWLHDRQLRARDWPVLSHPPLQSDVWRWIDADHRYNGLLWHEEARVRRAEASPDDIAAGARLIDRYTQKRADTIEAIDDALLAGLSTVALRPGARLAAESAGTMIDRLSTLALQLHDMRRQNERCDADADQRHSCRSRIDDLLGQRLALMACLDTLLTEARTGHAYFRTVRPSRAMGQSPLPVGAGMAP
jgi:hypothetical protein